MKSNLPTSIKWFHWGTSAMFYLFTFVTAAMMFGVFVFGKIGDGS